MNPRVLRAARIQQNAPRILRTVRHAVPDVVSVVGAAAGVLSGIGDAKFVARRAGGIFSERVFKGLDWAGLAAVGGSIEKQAAVAAGRRRVGANAVGVRVGAGGGRGRARGASAAVGGVFELAVGAERTRGTSLCPWGHVFTNLAK